MIAIAAGCAATTAATAAGAWLVIRGLRRRLAVALWQAQHDPLTGLLNRAGFAAAYQTHHHGQQPTIALIDLDDFKMVNDSYGHDVGDALLTVVADRVREGAAHYGGTAGRLSGDEFVIALPRTGMDPAAGVDLVVSLTCAPVAITIDGTVRHVEVDAAAGLAVAAPDEPLPAVLRRADLALYHAKHCGVPLVIHQPDMTMPALARRTGRLRDRHNQQEQQR
jgi:diguanylate cyclase (GGDEF)-like protein